MKSYKVIDPNGMFTVVKAKNAQQAQEKAIDLFPNMVISKIQCLGVIPVYIYTDHLANRK